MTDITQEEYFKRISDPDKIEDTQGWQLQSLYPGYSLYRGGLGVMSEYKMYDEDKHKPQETHDRARDRMLKQLSNLMINYLWRKRILTLEEKNSLKSKIRMEL